MSPASRRKKQISHQLHGHAIENVTSAKYLDVNIHDNMKWGTHINTITNTDNKTPGFPPAQPHDRKQEDKENCEQSTCSTDT